MEMAEGEPEPAEIGDSDALFSHGWAEDLLALIVGSIFVALGLAILHSSGIVTGGMAGAALLVSQFIPAPPGFLLAILSAPFVALGYISIGPLFALRTVAVSIAIALLSIAATATITVNVSNPLVASVAGGTLIGQGILCLLRHGAGMGGFGVLVIWLNRRFGWSVGIMQICVDSVVLGLSGLLLPIDKLGWSGVSAAMMALLVYICHRPGRYVATSRMTW